MPAAHFVWYELMTGDVAGAAAFYSDVVGWQARDSGMPGVEYTLLSVGDARVAGMMALPAELEATGVVPCWRGYVAVDDVDASEARLLQLGGKVLRPAGDIPGVGRFASVADPQGAAFVLFKPMPGEPPPMPPVGASGTPDWRELRATDGPAAFEFYAALLGWTKGESFGSGAGATGRYQLFEADGVPGGGIVTRDPAVPAVPAGGWRFYFRVDSVEAAARRVVRGGGTLSVAPHQAFGASWALHGVDPQGAPFALYLGGEVTAMTSLPKPRLKVGLVGYGYAGKTFHAPLVSAVPDLQLVAVASSNAAKVHADWPDVAVYATPAELVARADLDLVVVATPNDTHHAIARAALLAGRNVVVDKPFTVTLAEARELATLAQARGLLLSVFHNRRWDGDFLTLRRLVEEGALGRVVEMASRFDRFRPEVRQRWREGTDPGAGLWFDLGPHLVDQALQLFGPPRAITLARDHVRDGARADDWFHAHLRYDRLHVHLHASTVVAASAPRFAVHGTIASFVKEGLDAQEDALKDGARPVWPPQPGWGRDPGPAALVTRGADDRACHTPVTLQPGAHQAFFAGIATAIRGDAPNPVPPAQALAVMGLIELGIASATQRRELEWPIPG